MIFDTDVLIWIQRGSEKAARVVDRSIDRYISIVTYMELLQAANNKKQHDYISNFLREFGFQTLPLRTMHETTSRFAAQLYRIFGCSSIAESST